MRKHRAAAAYLICSMRIFRAASYWLNSAIRVAMLPMIQPKSTAPKSCTTIVTPTSSGVCGAMSP